jgi:hypothetical protein
MSQVDLVPGANSDGDSAPVAGPAAPSPDPGFSRLLDEATSRKPYLAPSSPPPSVAKYNVRNLLNGQFPPPDSGAGYLFANIALNAED